MAPSPTLNWRVLAAWVLLLGTALSAAAWVGTADRAHGEPKLHDAPVLVVGPKAVIVPLVQRMNGLRILGLELIAEPDIVAARERLRDGEALALVELDLTGVEDTVAFPRNSPQARKDQLRSTASLMAVAFGRETVEDTPGGVEPSTSRWVEPTAAFVSVGLGLITALVISILRGPVAPSFRLGIARAGLVALAGCAIAAIAATAGAAMHTAVALGLASFGAGTATLAAAVLGRFAELAMVGLVLVAAPMPLLLVGDRWFLTEPFRTVVDWTLAGAAAQVAAAPSWSAVEWPSVILLLGLPALALLVLLGWRGAVIRDPVMAADTDRRGFATSARASLVRSGLRGVGAGLLMFMVATHVLLGALNPVEPTTVLANRASSTTCAQTGEINSIADLNRIAQLEGNQVMRGGDVGASGLLQDRRTIWMFGDTLRDPDAPGGGFVRNSMLVIAPGCIEVVLPPNPGALIPDRPDGVGYWPMSVLVSHREGYDIVNVMAQRVRTVDADDVFGFETLGSAVATLVVPLGQTPQLVSVRDFGSDSADPTRPVWGAASATSAHGEWAYIYGTSRPAQVRPGIGFSLSLARVPIDELADLSQWEFWDGAHWGSDPRNAEKLISSKDGVSQTLSVFEDDGVWYALSKRNDFLGGDVVVWTAPSPTGPFEPQPPVATISSDPVSGTLRYMPLAHPALLRREGTVVISYSENRTDIDEVVDNPRLYRPRFLRVRLPKVNY